jgi:hypothetical protein
MGATRHLTDEEQENVRRALHYLHARIGAWIGTARAVRIKRATLRRVRAGQRVRLYLARKVATIAGVSIEDLRAGQFPPPGTCPNCGRQNLM